MKRILTVQDISCVGKCSLTVALPIISAFGIEASILPTATLSTHTAFKGFTFRDLTSDIEPICKHWMDQKIDFEMMARVITEYGADFVGLNEIRGEGTDPDYTAQTEQLARLTGMKYFYFAKAKSFFAKAN